MGVSSDALNMSKKGREPVFSQGERLAIVAALKPVDEVFLEESLELKRQYIEQFGADVLVMGDDWEGRFDEFKDICEVVYLPRTPAISTTALIEKIWYKRTRSSSSRSTRSLATAAPGGSGSGTHSLTWRSSSGSNPQSTDERPLVDLSSRIHLPHVEMWLRYRRGQAPQPGRT